MPDKPPKEPTDKPKPKKKPKKKLPQCIIPIKNPDKLFHEKWTPSRDPLDLPHPFRICLLGKPNSGKTTIMKNIIVRCTPEFEEILLVHCDGDNTAEFDDLDVEVIDSIPHITDLDPDVKRLIILEDLEYGQMPKEQKACLDRLYGYASTHKNTSVMMTSQDGFSIPAICRRCCNIWVIWKVDDTDSMNTIGRRIGLKKAQIEGLFNEHLNDSHDSLWVDLTKNTPFPLRINGYQMISKPPIK
jgi:hypothetical protein